MIPNQWQTKSDELQEFIEQIGHLAVIAICVYLYDLLKRVRERKAGTDAEAGP